MAFTISLLRRKLMSFYTRAGRVILHLFLDEGYILFYIRHLCFHSLINRLGLLRTCILISFGHYFFQYLWLQINLSNFIISFLNFNLLFIRDYYDENYQNVSSHSQLSSYL